MDETLLPASEATEPTSEETTPSSEYQSDVTFAELPLSDEIKRSIADRGYTHPTPVQAQAIPKVIEGKDLIVRSKTGTGKTAAFSIPVLERLPAGSRKPLGLVLCPTRELALQVAEEATALGQHKDLRVAAIYGGAPMGAQVKALEDGAELIVGTPGRVYDHIRRGTLDLSGAMVAVLDEADEMLSMGFFEEVTRILDKLPKSRQTLLFSATVPPDIERLIRKYLKDPETLLLSGDVYTVEGIAHVAYKMVEDYPKPRNLLYLLELENPDSAIIFANTRDDTSLVTAVLNRNGYDAELLNGDLPQKERERVMAKVKKGEVRYMVATDIAARGIDISDLSHVINYSLPEDPAVYLHRVGRTGRIGKTGTAISLVGGREYLTRGTLEKQFNIQFEERKLPNAEEARKLWTERHVAELREGMGASVFEAFIPLAQELKKRTDGEFLIAYALKYFFQHHRMEKVKEKLLAEGAEAAREEAPPRRREREERRDRGARGERGPRRERPERREPRERRPRAVTGEEGEVAATLPVPHVHATGSVEEPAAPPTEELEGEPREDRGAKLWVSLGEEDGLDVEGVKAALAELGGADAGKVKHIDVRPAHSFVYVERDALDAFLAANGKSRGEKEVKVERARRPRRRR
ncbi:DEAD/DEAH box helicase [Vulgatibacter sp.]|uniref:DEAD/DEAH box helicase n=1 Tax=Vulgatibacter sp. TaxID=1971226 RepID=UPI00356B3068